MPKPQARQEELEQAMADLLDYAFDREDVKYLLARLPREAPVTPAKVEYELQILKIVTVGWSLSYHLHPALRPALPEFFWQSVRRLAAGLSQTTGRIIGQPVDYFAVLKERFETYRAALAADPGAAEPARVIGPEFARVCGRAEDLFAFMAGSKMFISATGRVEQYLRALGLTADG